MRNLLLLTACFILLLTGCSTPNSPGKYKFDKVKVYHSSYDNIWNKTLEWLTDNHIPIKTLDKSSGFIATERVHIASLSDCDCGNIGFTNLSDDKSEKIIWYLNILIITDSPNENRVKINTFYRFFEHVPEDNEFYNYECNSTGKLENQLFNYLEQNIK